MVALVPKKRKAHTLRRKIKKVDLIFDNIDLPTKEVAAKTIAAVSIKKAMAGDISFIREVGKYLNLDPYINEEFELITKKPLAEQHAAILKLFAKNCITEEKAIIFDKLVTHAIELEMVKKFDDRLKALELKRKR